MMAVCGSRYPTLFAKNAKKMGHGAFMAWKVRKIPACKAAAIFYPQIMKDLPPHRANRPKAAIFIAPFVLAARAP
jgi:hypothetical protein